MTASDSPTDARLAELEGGPSDVERTMPPFTKPLGVA